MSYGDAAMAPTATRRRGRSFVHVRCRVRSCSWVFSVMDEAPAILAALHERKAHEEAHILWGECPDRTRL